MTKVLLVDDDPAVRASLKFSLELEGFDVEVFDSGEALTERGELPDSGCLVLDYHLSGIDGLKLLDRLRQEGVGLPAVIITSNPTRNIRSRTAVSGALLIEKPLLCDALSTALRSLTDQSGSRLHPSEALCPTNRATRPSRSSK